MTQKDHTNNAQDGRQEWKVLLVLILSLVVLEMGVRHFAQALSADMRNLLSSPQSAARISDAPQDSKTLLIVGNSLARHGVDLDFLSQYCPEVEAVLFAPDASSIVKWNWGLKRYFCNTGAHPDIIILITGRVHLLDLPASPETLGAYFVDNRDLGAALKSMPSDEQSLRLLLGRCMHLAANRDRVRTRIGYACLPGFEVAWPTLAVGNAAEAVAGRGNWHPDTAEVQALKSLIATSKEMGSALHVVSVPMPEPYQLPKPVCRLLEASGVAHHEFSVVNGIGAGNFPDGYHLDEEGSRIFTRILIRDLQPSLTSLSDP